MTTDTPAKTAKAAPKKAASKAKKAAPTAKKAPVAKKAGPKASKKTSTPKAPKAPRARASKKPEFGSKTAFIKTQPSTMTAKEVVAAAKAQGITLSENLVYAARAGAKKGGSKKARKGASKPGPKPKKASKGSGSLEATLRNAIAELGLAASRRVFEEVTAAFQG